MSEGHLIETIEDGIATLTMNRPESLNALSAEMMSGLRESVPRLAADDNVRVVILTGAGRAFCAGGSGSDRRAQPSLERKGNFLAVWPGGGRGVAGVGRRGTGRRKYCLPAASLGGRR